MTERPERWNPLRWALSISWLARLRSAVLAALVGSSGGRRLLATLTTVYARWITRDDVRVFFDGVWGHSVAGLRVPDSRRYFYPPDGFARWSGEPAKWRRAAEKYWCRYYKPQPGDTIVDVGAGMGSDVLFFSPAVGNTGKIIAIEANPNTYALLAKLCEWNGFNNVVCTQQAVVDTPGEVWIEDESFHEANAVTSGSRRGSVPVQGVRLDDMLERLGVAGIALLKMNIEGAERAALAGMRATLARTRYVCIACHDFRADAGEGEGFRTRDFVTRTLQEQGFRILDGGELPDACAREHVHAIRAG